MKRVRNSETVAATPRQAVIAIDHLLLDEEADREAYQAHVDAYVESLHPATGPEHLAVRRAATAMWCWERLSTIETGLLQLSLCKQMQRPFPVTDELAYAIRFQDHVATLGNGRREPFLVCQRYIETAQKDMDAAIECFFRLQAGQAAA